MSDPYLPASAEMPSARQVLFARYFIGFLIDLVVLNLFDQYSDKVFVASFTISLLAALLLQALLKLTIALERRLTEFFSARPGALMICLRVFFAWLVMFGSKFVILEAIDVLLGDAVRFEGAGGGVVALVVIIMTMVLAEEAVVRFYRSLG